MKTAQFLVLIVIAQLSLTACHTFKTEGQDVRKPSSPHVKYIATKNLEWDYTNEADQELADEI